MAPSVSSSRSSRLTLWFSSAAHAFSHLFVLLYATVLLVLEDEFNLPFADLAWLAVPGFVLFGVCALPAGWLGDRWSSMGMLAIFFIGLALASFVTGMADDPTGLLVGLTLIGLFASIYHPVGLALVVKNAEARGRALGINGVFGSLGTAAAAVVAGALADNFGWRTAFFVPGAVCLITGIGFCYVIAKGWIDDPEHDVVEQPKSSSRERMHAFMLLGLTVLCSGLIFQTTSVGLPKVFDERLAGVTGGGALGAGLLVSAVYLFSAAGQLLGGEMADRYPLKWVYFGSQLAQIPVIMVALFSHSLVLVAAAALMVSMNVAGQPAENALLAGYTPVSWRARIFGIKGVLTLGLGAGGIALIPIIHEATGSMDGLFVALAIFAGLSAAITLALPSLQTREKTAEGAE